MCMLNARLKTQSTKLPFRVTRVSKTSCTSFAANRENYLSVKWMKVMSLQIVRLRVNAVAARIKTTLQSMPKMTKRQMVKNLA